jgi:hypothetical protein
MRSVMVPAFRADLAFSTQLRLGDIPVRPLRHVALHFR